MHTITPEHAERQRQLDLWLNRHTAVLLMHHVDKPATMSLYSVHGKTFCLVRYPEGWQAFLPLDQLPATADTLAALDQYLAVASS